MPRQADATTDAAEIKITPEMIEAAVGRSLPTIWTIESREDTVSRIYEAMTRARKDQ